MRTVIIATLTEVQLEYIKGLAAAKGIKAEYIIGYSDEGYSQEAPEPQRTPITGEMLDSIESATSMPIFELAKHAAELNITTIEEALASPDIGNDVKEVLEQYI